MTISGDFERSTRPAPRWWVFSSSNAFSCSHRWAYSAASSVAGAWVGSSRVVRSRTGASSAPRDGWERVYSTTLTAIGPPGLPRGARRPSAGLPGRLRRPPGRDLRPVRSHDRYRTVHRAGRTGHDPGAVRLRRPRVLGGRQGLVTPGTESHRPSRRTVPQRGHGAHTGPRVLAQPGRGLLLHHPAKSTVPQRLHQPRHRRAAPRSLRGPLQHGRHQRSRRPPGTTRPTPRNPDPKRRPTCSSLTPDELTNLTTKCARIDIPWG